MHKRICAIEASTGTLTLALGTEAAGVVLTRVGEQAARGELVFSLLDALLAEAGWQASEIGLWVAGSGPGSFTGVRMALGTIAGIAFASGAESRAVNSFEAIRYTLAGTVLALLPYRTDEFYGEVSKDGKVLSEASVMTGAEALALSELHQVQAWCGAAAQSAREQIEASGASMSCRIEQAPEHLTPNATSVLRAAIAGHGGSALDAKYVAPPRITTPGKRS
jgi:tRNA threonylcarbamoyl adenosine modification protein YeaZ